MPKNGKPPLLTEKEYREVFGPRQPRKPSDYRPKPLTQKCLDKKLVGKLLDRGLMLKG